MSQTDIIARMLPVFQEVFDDDTLRITAGTTSEDVEDWDSLSNVRLIIAIERAFGVRIKASEVALLDDVGSLADLVAQKLAAGPGA